MHRLGLACALVLVTAVSAAQEQSQAPVFRSGVNLVTVDVTVVDKDGNPVGDLTPDDFVARIDGKVRPVQTLDFLRFGPAAIGNAPSPASASPAPAAPSRGAQTFMLVFDDLSFTPGAGKGMSVAGERLLKQLDVGAMVGVIASSGLGPNVSPTRNRAEAEAALKTLVGRNVDDAAPFFIGAQEAIDIERGLVRDALETVANRECPIVYPDLPEGLCENMVKGRARGMAVSARHRVEQQLSSLQQIVSAMAKAPAPRVVVVMTAGVSLQAETNMKDPLDLLSDTAAEAGVQLYALVAEADGIDMRDTGEARATARRAENGVLSEGMMSVATATGGSAFRVVGTADRFFARVVSETSAVYRLGVPMTDTPVGNRPLRAEVSVRRDGVTVRTTGRALAEVAPPAAAPMSRDEAMKLRLAQGGTASGVPVRVAARQRKNNAPGIQVMVDARLPSSVPTPVNLMFGLMDQAGTMVFAGSKALPTAPAGDEHHILFPIAVAAGSYRLRLVAGDATDQIGSVEVAVAAGLTRLGEFDVSDVMTVYPSSGGQDMFSAFEEAPAGATEVVTSLELYQTGAVAPGPSTTVHFTITAPDDEAPLVERTTTPVSSSDRWTASATLPLDVIDPGRYLIRATLMQGDVIVGTQTRVLIKGAPGL